MSNEHLPVSQRVLDQAIDWQLRMSSGESTERDTIALEFWLSAHSDHARAWRQLGALDAELAPARSSTLRSILTKPLKARRIKRVATTLATVLAMMCSLTLFNQYQPLGGLLADYHTTTGERQLIVLPDNTVIRLNTRSAIDIAYDETQRAVILREGEIEVETGHNETESRPFVILNAAGSMRALGTRFSVRTLDDGSALLSVSESAVIARPASCQPQTVAECDPQQLVEEGQSIILHGDALSPILNSPAYLDAWKDGMLVVENAALEDVAAELSRYRFGRIKVDPEVAQLRITGTFSVDDTDFAIAALAAALPVRLTKLGGFWVSFDPPKEIGFVQTRAK
ncbi:FecR family protein [Methylobacillus gramineus]|uniref:FecR domain-containing protein n=1 Tax=Methylobacillus gramineus TaxID=755169 RepID=UPI001CFFF21B|nr:FecR family protein [Methylobacillus gramineus]MCB5186217.1 FecR family protein [Methylobacillus gramineus]